MRDPIEIENVESTRPRQGIAGLEFQKSVHRLRVGDLIKLTLRRAIEAFAGETLLVRITRIQDSAFCGRLASRPTSACLADVPVGLTLAFTAAQIHSIPKRRLSDER